MEDLKDKRILARFISDTGEDVGCILDIPLFANVEQLTSICNNILQKEEDNRLSFYVDDKEITNTLKDVLELEKYNPEDVIRIVYQQESSFRVRAVTRCTSSIPGHTEAVISVKFSPDGQKLASGSGDTTVRFWDTMSQTPLHLCKGHNNWVLCIAWSPDSERLVSGCKSGVILQWDSATGKSIGRPMTGHKQWITALVWQPFHLSMDCRLFASCAKDGDVRIWDSILCQCIRSLTSHTMSISSIHWGGSNLIYSSSQDRTIKVWRALDGVLCRSLDGHAHWVNTLALNTDYAMKSFNLGSESIKDKQELQKIAQSRYETALSGSKEMLASGSDDFTIYLWNPEVDKKPVARLTGHQQLINCVQFSPDGRILASASFDKSIKLWNGKTGKFIATLRGHVQAVYMISWAADSESLVSGSADSTLKVWNTKKKRLLVDLPGHLDEVYAVDWSIDGSKVASGGKDKTLKLWQY